MHSKRGSEPARDSNLSNTTNASQLLRLLVGIDHFLRRPKRIDGRRYTGIHRAMQQRFTNLFHGAAIVQRTAHVTFQFLRALQRGQRGEGDQAAGFRQ